MENALGYALALVMGLTLGVIGAGGSIMTVPILVYLFGIEPVVATGYSLLIVGLTALAGAVRYGRHGQVDFRAALTFAAPATIMVLLTRRYIIPALPATIMKIGALSVSKDMLVMVLFAALMVAAALFMLKPAREKTVAAPAVPQRGFRMFRLVGGSAGVGLLTGMVGAGGGFLIIPTLIALFGLDMKKAIGTSLSIIAINALIGFNGDLVAGIHLRAGLLAGFVALTLIGIIVGVSIGRHAHPARLRQLFGIFTLIAGCAILLQELYAATGFSFL
ncbi:MAG: sulfite exporter TauE/SafE family protein [Alphaproteobacteria bacterium]|nr:sulfite exporter TauE/SafE family protein [Alphaproteobacteria bacterium]